ncbi:hypothetical protein C8F04DRAFT_1253259 [Mycena alexandri]|uniref:Uncharacterized protein n=1 Tax=Mycena alexandri TaxID=1745969 RepID=A0AAD6XAD3_9AGAR|nr:hypothetical protein C8F04DRAFT_1253259 [Mycena alexandri]
MPERLIFGFGVVFILVRGMGRPSRRSFVGKHLYVNTPVFSSSTHPDSVAQPLPTGPKWAFVAQPPRRGLPIYPLRLTQEGSEAPRTCNEGQSGRPDGFVPSSQS